MLRTTLIQPNHRFQYMSTFHRTARSLATAILILLWLQYPAPAAADCLPFTSQNGNVITQDFPPTGPTLTSWRVTFGHDPKHGLFVRFADFRRGPNEPWLRVLYDARVSETFVPYDQNGSRFYESNYTDLIPVVPADLGACGQKADDYVVKEIRERGPIWKYYSQVRRGHELWLWGGWSAVNYNYIIRYHFRDDGSIGFRIGATARNLPSMPWRVHSHTALWRVDIDLGGAAHDSVKVHRHHETTGFTWADVTTDLYNGGTEGWLDWNPLQFTMLNIEDTQLKNEFDRNISYDFMVMRTGSPRHVEPFAHHDFAVTNYRWGEMYYPDLPSYLQPGQSINDRDVVVWYASPGLHMPRTEDGIPPAPTGSALLMWSGFDLKPRNLFNGTPLYP